MADPNKKYFAKLGVDNIVISCHVVNPQDCLDSNGVHSELVGQQFLQSIHNFPAEKWIEYSSTAAFRTNSAATGGTYDSANDVFINASPFASWMLSAEYQWEAPVTYPTDTGDYPIQWDEENQKWTRNLNINMSPDGYTKTDWDPNSKTWV